VKPRGRLFGRARGQVGALIALAGLVVAIVAGGFAGPYISTVAAMVAIAAGAYLFFTSGDDG
jgi:hypothetical protein